MQAAPTEIDLIKDTIDVLTNSSAPPEEILIAMEVLQSLVEPIDNANGKLAHGCIWCTEQTRVSVGIEAAAASCV